MEAGKLMELVLKATNIKKPLLDLQNLSYLDLRSFYEKMNYPYYTEKKEFNLNVAAIRSSDLTVNVFNDVIIVSWEWLGKGHVHLFRGTTDPGLTYLNKPEHPKGTAIMVPGYYKSVYCLGYHRKNTPFSHLALRQKEKMKYWRVSDYKLDSQLPINNPIIYEDLAYTNLHCYPKHYKKADLINNLSMGCIVVEDNQRYFYEFIPIIQEAKKNFDNSFSFALFYEPYLI